MEQGTGVEPAFTAWEAVVLPIYEPCGYDPIIADRAKKFKSDFSSSFVRFFSFALAYFEVLFYSKEKMLRRLL